MYICLSGLIFMAIGFILGMKYSNKEIIKMHNISIKYWKMYEITVQWLKKQDNIEGYMAQKGYETIAVYGMSHLGDCLTTFLRKKRIEVIYGIDRNADKLYNSYVPIYNVNTNLPTVDLIIVTTVMSFEDIKSDLKEKLGNETSIVSLEEILMEA